MHWFASWLACTMANDCRPASVAEIGPQCYDMPVCLAFLLDAVTINPRRYHLVQEEKNRSCSPYTVLHGAFMNTQHLHVLEHLVYKEAVKMIISHVTILFFFLLHKTLVIKEVFQLQCIALLHPLSTNQKLFWYQRCNERLVALTCLIQELHELLPGKLRWVVTTKAVVLFAMF